MLAFYQQVPWDMQQAQGALLDVQANGTPCGTIAFAPHTLVLPTLAKGPHRIRIRLFNTCCNAFGALHNANPNDRWYGPAAYRTRENEWSESYHVKPVGILSRIELIKEAPAK